MTKNLCFYSGPLSMSRYFLSFETFVLFAQAPDEGNQKLTGIYSGHTWVCVMVKLILL